MVKYSHAMIRNISVLSRVLNCAHILFSSKKEGIYLSCKEFGVKKIFVSDESLLLTLYSHSTLKEDHWQGRARQAMCQEKSL